MAGVQRWIGREQDRIGLAHRALGPPLGRRRSLNISWRSTGSGRGPIAALDENRPVLRTTSAMSSKRETTNASISGTHTTGAISRSTA